MSSQRRRIHTAASLAALALLGAAAFAAQDGTKPPPKAPEQAAPPAEKVIEDDAAVLSIRKSVEALLAEKKVDKAKEGWKTAVPKPEVAKFDPKHTYFWILKTNKGPIKIKLMPAVAPMHVTSTIYLTQLGFYDGTVFHRVIPGFMAQGGDPLGNGTGSPGYQYDGEFSPEVKHDKPGLLSMANRGPGTDASQFFLTFVPTPHLDGKHTIFGSVVEGMETLKALEALGSQTGKTSEKLFIESATIRVVAAE